MLKFATTALLFMSFNAMGVSLEVVDGNQRIFVDTQWFHAIPEFDGFSVFTRARATANDNTQNTFYIGSYINYTAKNNAGLSLVARTATNSSGFDAGIHYFKATDAFSSFTLFSINTEDSAFSSLFSVSRYKYPLETNSYLYFGFELFSSFKHSDHLATITRNRIGYGYKNYQIGLALNTLNIGSNVENVDQNWGLFFRAEF